PNDIHGYSHKITVYPLETNKKLQEFQVFKSVFTSAKNLEITASTPFQ
ncbi:551_t:CDS:2, partial [Rhizophagus irregularis]